MKFLVDAQLPPSLGVRLRAAGHEAWHVGDLAALDAADTLICALARQRGCAIITKDADFLRLAGVPPLQVVWIRIGNCGNARLVELVLGQLAAVVAAFGAGETLVEIR